MSNYILDLECPEKCVNTSCRFISNVYKARENYARRHHMRWVLLLLTFICDNVIFSLYMRIKRIHKYILGSCIHVYICVYIRTHLYIRILQYWMPCMYLYNPVTFIAIRWIIGNWFQNLMIPYALGIECCLCIAACMAGFLFNFLLFCSLFYGFVFVFVLYWCILVRHIPHCCAYQHSDLDLDMFVLPISVSIHVLGHSEWCLCPSKFHVSRVNSSPLAKVAAILADDNLKCIYSTKW